VRSKEISSLVALTNQLQKNDGKETEMITTKGKDNIEPKTPCYTNPTASSSIRQNMGHILENRRKSSIDGIKRPKTPNFKSKQKPYKHPVEEKTTKNFE
jgi:hypothetical protein